MEKRLVLLFLMVPFFIAVCSSVCEAQVYKWVDEKGTVHFSDGPSAVAGKNEDRNQDKDKDQNKNKSQYKGQDKNVDKRQDKNSWQKNVKNQDVRQINSPDKNRDKKVAKEDAQAILKNLEFGNRHIPDDMKKYGPSGGYERPRDPDQTASSPPVRRTSS